MIIINQGINEEELVRLLLGGEQLTLSDTVKEGDCGNCKDCGKCSNCGNCGKCADCGICAEC